jgi:hypothetical protein
VFVAAGLFRPSLIFQGKVRNLLTVEYSPIKDFSLRRILRISQSVFDDLPTTTQSNISGEVWSLFLSIVPLTSG